MSMSEHAYSARGLPSGSAAARDLAHRGGSQEPPRSGPRTPLLIASACILALALVWVVAELVPAAHVRDAIALHDFTRLDSHARVHRVAEFLVHLMNVDLFILWGIALVAYAISRRRHGVAAAIAVVLSFAPLTSEKLKPLLAHSHARVGAVQIGPASWPSGHSTAAMALVLCIALAAPARLRPAAIVLGAGFAVAVGISLLILAWHMPSDVIGGYLIAGLWMALAVAALRFFERRRPSAREL
jgi:membrane-associated phospholipid phosphatase